MGLGEGSCKEPFNLFTITIDIFNYLRYILNIALSPIDNKTRTPQGQKGGGEIEKNCIRQATTRKGLSKFINQVRLKAHNANVGFVFDETFSSRHRGKGLFIYFKPHCEPGV